ncbi:MAG: hypothetical protein WCD11_09520 [Solirubrobacteraceae bacterium]
MHDNLQHLVAEQRIADHLRAAERARLASGARAERRDPHDAEPITNVRARLCRPAARLAS